MRKNFTLLICLIFLGFGSPIHAQLVTNGDDSGDGSLRQEIIDTPPGGVVTFDPGVTNVQLSGLITVRKDITISGPEGSTVTIDANGNSRAFTFAGNASTKISVELNNLSIINGAAPSGGGIFVKNSNVTINDSEILNNIADDGFGSGGGILLITGGTLIINNSSITGNSAVRAGGGIEVEADEDQGVSLTLNNVDLSNNSAGPYLGLGGGLHITGLGFIDINNTQITNNIAASEGAGIWNGAGEMTITNSTIDGNIASGTAGDNGGGGIYNNGGTLNIVATTISNNSAGSGDAAGGAIHNGAGGTTTVTRSTISTNSASGAGGGIANVGTSVDVNASTIALNTSGTSGGGIAGVTEVTITNTIVAYNTASSGNDVFGLVTSADYNLVQDDDLSIFTPMANDIIGEDPLAGPLQDNGGDTFTHALLGNSPAFNTGNPADTFDDQRGFEVFDGIRDIGSFEAQVVLSISDFNDVSISNIYPNPTNGIFYVQVGNTITSDLNLEIVSITGQLMNRYPMSVGRNEINIDGMSAGIYILNISDGQNKISHKLVLQ